MVLAAVLAVLVLSSILIGGGFVLLRGKGKKYFQKGRISSRPTTGLTNPLFQEGARPHQLSLRAIGCPSLLSTTAAPRDARPLVPGCPLLQEKPKPPTKPLPALKTKQPCNMAAGEALPPTPPAKPPALSFQPRAIPVLPQRGVPPKLALKPPASRR